MGAAERVIRHRLREGAPRALRMLECFSGAPQRGVRGTPGVLVGEDVEHESPARDLPLTQLTRPPQRHFEIGDPEREPPHLGVYPAAARARPDLRGDAK